MVLALILQSVALKFAPPELARQIFLSLIFCWVAFYPAQVASIIRIEPRASMIALSLNASAMYLGFAIGGVIGAVVLPAMGRPTSAGSAVPASRRRWRWFWCTGGRNGQNRRKLPVDGSFLGVSRLRNLV